MLWGRRKTLERVSSSRWVRGPGAHKIAATSEEGGGGRRQLKELQVAWTLCTSWLSFCCDMSRCRGGGKRSERKKWGIAVQLISAVTPLWIEARPGQTTTEKGADYQDRRLPTTTAVWLSPRGPEREAYKSLLIKTRPFIDGLMSLGL